MKINFSAHALERMSSRNITKNDVLDVLKNYDFVEEQDDIAIVYSKIMKRKNKKYMYRIFVNKTLKPAKVITVYRTSKFEKYGY